MLAADKIQETRILWMPPAARWRLMLAAINDTIEHWERKRAEVPGGAERGPAEHLAWGAIPAGVLDPPATPSLGCRKTKTTH